MRHFSPLFLLQTSLPKLGAADPERRDAFEKMTFAIQYASFTAVKSSSAKKMRGASKQIIVHVVSEEEHDQGEAEYVFQTGQVTAYVEFLQRTVGYFCSTPNSTSLDPNLNSEIAPLPRKCRPFLFGNTGSDAVVKPVFHNEAAAASLAKAKI